MSACSVSQGIYLQCAFWGCCLKQEPVAEAPVPLLPPARAQGLD